MSLSTSLPLVSAVITTYRRPHLILRAVQCALDQTYSNVEVVVVVDGPHAETEAVLAGIANERVRVVVNQLNVGQAEARNNGIRHARGAWIALLDDDDLWLPEKIARQMAVALEIDSPCVLVVCQYVDRSPHAERILPYTFPRGTDKFSEYLFCERGSLLPSTWLVTRELMLRIPFMPFVYRMAIEDQEWLMRAAACSETRIGIVAEPLTIYNNTDYAMRQTSNGSWEVSNLWGMTHRKLFTRKAFSYFMVTYCITRARQNKAGLRVYLYLISVALLLGSVRPRTIVYLLSYLVLPGTSRRAIRSWWARSRA